MTTTVTAPVRSAFETQLPQALVITQPAQLPGLPARIEQSKDVYVTAHPKVVAARSRLERLEGTLAKLGHVFAPLSLGSAVGVIWSLCGVAGSLAGGGMAPGLTLSLACLAASGAGLAASFRIERWFTALEEDAVAPAKLSYQEAVAQVSSERGAGDARQPGETEGVSGEAAESAPSPPPWSTAKAIEVSLAALCVDLAATRTSRGFRSVVEKIATLAARRDASESTKLAALECLEREERSTRQQASVVTLPYAVARIGLSGGGEARQKAVALLGTWTTTWRTFGPHMEALHDAQASLLTA